MNSLKILLVSGSLLSTSEMVLAADLVATMNGRKYHLDVQQGVLYEHLGQKLFSVISRDWANGQRLGSAPTDDTLLILRDSKIYACSPIAGSTGRVLAGGMNFEPSRIQGIAGYAGFAFVIFEDEMWRMPINGSPVIEKVSGGTLWRNTEGFAANHDGLLAIQGGMLHRIAANGGYVVIGDPATSWRGTTAIQPAADGCNFVVVQNSAIHLVNGHNGTWKGGFEER